MWVIASRFSETTCVFSVFRGLWVVGMVCGRLWIPRGWFSPCRKQPADGARGGVCAVAVALSGREATLAANVATRTYPLETGHVGKASDSGQLVVSSNCRKTVSAILRLLSGPIDQEFLRLRAPFSYCRGPCVNRNLQTHVKNKKTVWVMGWDFHVTR